MNQTWYADDAGVAGKFDSIRSLFKKLQDIGPHYGYFPEPSKSILIVTQDNLEAATAAFADLDFKITTGYRYLGAFIGEKDARDTWIKEKVVNWIDAVTELASAAVKYPQAAYTGLQKSLQQE
jgi:hypothetical protein